MKRIYGLILVLGGVCNVIGGCDFLDPLQNGSYNEDNYMNYPDIMEGIVAEAYSFLPGSYYATEYIGTDAGTDDAVYRNQTGNMREFSVGTFDITSNPFSSLWNRDYRGISYCNMFLKDRTGINTHYLLDHESDMVLRRTLQGDAFALRAWFHYDLLKTFGGVGTDGNLLGVPVMTSPSEVDKIDYSDIRRASFDDTVAQILADCDSAEAYLPYNNKDYPGDPVYSTPITGSARYRRFDQVSVNALRAAVYLIWASPAFNPDGDMSRYFKAAEYAALVIDHKFRCESTLTGGFDPMTPLNWSNLNSAEVIAIHGLGDNSTIETHFYPQGFGGSASIVPTQDLVDAYPAANGYPITDIRSGYDESRPYDGRDPRFDAAIFRNGSTVLRNTNSTLMYTFDTTVGGKDGPGLTETSPTSYYIKKFVYMGWNPYDTNVVEGAHALFLFRWEQICLIFAEAASKVVSPTEEATFGFSAKQALSWLRSRSTIDGNAGVGNGSDPYLDECAANPSQFESLVKNEWRITTCFEGMRFYNLRRWTADHSDLSAINVDVHGAAVTASGIGYDYSVVTIEHKNYPSLWLPIPYLEVRRCPNLIQNRGYENWK